MTARTFWTIVFSGNLVLEIAGLLYGSSVLSDPWRPWISGLALGMGSLGMMLEGWQTDTPRATDKRWLKTFGTAGVLYPIPTVLALFGRVSPWFLIVSLLAFGCLVWRMVWLRLNCMRTSIPQRDEGE